MSEKTLGEIAFNARMRLTGEGFDITAWQTLPVSYQLDYERAALAVVAAHEAARWTRVEDGLPESGVPVIAFIRYEDGVTRRIRAQYAAPMTLEVSPEAECDADHDEENDVWYCAPGWYETNEYEETHWAVTDTVIAWCSLPPAPGGG